MNTNTKEEIKPLTPEQTQELKNLEHDFLLKIAAGEVSTPRIL